MNIAVLHGSNRKERKGINAARFIINKLKQRGHDAVLIDTMEYPLPFLDKMHKEYKEGQAPLAMEKIHHLLVKADAFVVVSAEYNHSVPAALKNLLDHFQTEYYFKPSAIVSYSAGPFGGLRVAMHLRAVLAELGMPSIPTIFPVSSIHKSIDADGVAIESAYEQRVKSFLDELEWYAEALLRQREKGVPY